LPLVLSGLPRHAVVIRLPRAADASVSADLKPLLQASTWLKLLLDAHRAREPAVAPVATVSPASPAAPAAATQAAAGAPAARDALDLLAATLEHRDLPGAAASLVNQLAALLRVARVSLGLLDDGDLRLVAVSGSAGFEASTALAGAVRAAMTEAVRQAATLAAPEDPSGGTRETGAQRMLLREARCGAVWSLPFAAGGEVIGAVTVEWPADAPADPALRDRCASMLALAGPVLSALRRAGETPSRRLLAAWTARLREIAGPRHPFLKVAAGALVLVLLLAAIVPGTQRVAGDAVLRGSVQRVVLAPVDGYVATATARPGDVVAAGDLLATLDDQALQLELAKWQAEYDRLVNEYREAMSQLDSAKVTVLRSEIDRAAAEFQLAEDNLERSGIRAPLAGIVVSGDFTQKVGAPVRRGDTLFELAPLDGYRIGIRVPETDVGAVAPGQRGRLLLQSLPGEGVDIVVERVTPVSEVVDGRNVFEVEARLAGDAAPPAGLRPGMQGVAKLDVGRARLLWLWTHRATDWLRLTLWGAGIWG
jgi:biotin carboxyl carrier protein